MSSARSDLPTLTEVIELHAGAESPYAPTAPMPIQDESVALDDDGPDTLQFEEPTPADNLLHLHTPAEQRALAQDEDLVAQVLARLQPRLEAWVEAQVRHALTDMLPVWSESAALSIARDLRVQMPELLSLALDEVHRQRGDKARG